jgi:triacylglycerol lipase
MLMSVVQIHLSPPNPKSLLALLAGIFFEASSPQSLCIMGRNRTMTSHKKQDINMTNARIQRFIVLSSLLFWALIAAWLWDTQPVLAWLCLGMPLIVTPLILGIQCAWAASVNRADPAPRASAAQWVGAWLAEWRVAILVFMWWQPFGHRAIPDNLQPTQGRRGMVLVHGFFCNRALWTHWMRLLTSQGRVFVSVDLEPAYGSISSYAQVIEQAVAAVEKATGLPPVIVGHSMGGLAIRAWAAHAGGPGLAHAHRIFTLGTPHYGTAIAAASHTENGRQMRQSSTWLAENASLLPDNFAKQCTCYFSHCDNIVFPASTATLSGADNRHMVGHAHVQLVFAPDIQKACWAALET